MEVPLETPFHYLFFTYFLVIMLSAIAIIVLVLDKVGKKNFAVVLATIVLVFVVVDAMYMINQMPLILSQMLEMTNKHKTAWALIYFISVIYTVFCFIAYPYSSKQGQDIIGISFLILIIMGMAMLNFFSIGTLLP